MMGRIGSLFSRKKTVETPQVPQGESSDERSTTQEVFDRSEHLCCDCDRMLKSFQFVEVDTYRLMTDHKLRKGIVYDTIVSHRKLHKLAALIKCGKIERLY